MELEEALLHKELFLKAHIIHQQRVQQYVWMGWATEWGHQGNDSSFWLHHKLFRWPWASPVLWVLFIYLTVSGSRRKTVTASETNTILGKSSHQSILQCHENYTSHHFRDVILLPALHSFLCFSFLVIKLLQRHGVWWLCQESQTAVPSGVRWVKSVE